MKNTNFYFVFVFSSPAEDCVLLPGAWYPLSATSLQEWRGYWTSTVSTSLFCSLRVKVRITWGNFWSFWRLANIPSLKDQTSTVVASVKMMLTALCKWTRSYRSWGRRQLIGPLSNWHQIVLYYMSCFMSMLRNILAISRFMQWSYLHRSKSMFHRIYHRIHVSKQQWQWKMVQCYNYFCTIFENNCFISCVVAF